MRACVVCALAFRAHHSSAKRREHVHVCSQTHGVSKSAVLAMVLREVSRTLQVERLLHEHEQAQRTLFQRLAGESLSVARSRWPRFNGVIRARLDSSVLRPARDGHAAAHRALCGIVQRLSGAAPTASASRHMRRHCVPDLQSTAARLYECAHEFVSASDEGE
ncbi:hypothetical protein MSPP1_003829 [Malassezia sp. CBS 17886]|nr:hypothetical protein MSPP1_003829 [Malassezia sp. CBS 17886]